MKTIVLKVARIGNSRGVRIPAATLERYHIGARVVMEERGEGILFRPHGRIDPKLSWEDTARAMADASEDWTAWDSALSDGLDSIPWTVRGIRRAPKVAESGGTYKARAARRTVKG